MIRAVIVFSRHGGENTNPQMNIFCERVVRVRQKLGPDSVMLIPNAPAKIRNRDTHYPYRAHSDIIYLTGVNEEELSVVLTPDELHIFAQVRDPARERWVGKVKGHEFFLERFNHLDGKVILHESRGFRKSFDEIVKGKKTLYYDFGGDFRLDNEIFGILNDVASNPRKGAFAPRQVIRAAEILNELRLFKDVHDLESMRIAARISAIAHNAVTEKIGNSGRVSEFEIKALIEHEFMRQGADRLAYPSIVAGGANATVLHYEGTGGGAETGEFMLIDAGAEYSGYASDITRTTIVGGRNKSSQLKRDLYDLVKHAQTQAIAKSMTGETIHAVHEAAIDVLATGLMEMGFFKNVPLRHKDKVTGNIEEVKERTLTSVDSLDQIRELEYFNLFYMHKTSHYLGLDGHDASTLC
jgi:Xaa-Pro aminopeptidase